MKLKTPEFWYRDMAAAPSPAECALAPLSALYTLGYHTHQAMKTPQKVNARVICIGNLNAGGTGKTPTALALMDLLRREKLALRPCFLLRGYGGGDPGPFWVDPGRHNAWNSGDEALILAKAAPTVVSVNRVEGALLAIREGTDVVIMDDGLQNPGIQKDIKIVVINGDMGFGNGRMMPAGPLRQPLQEGLAAADAFILIGEDRRNVAALLPSGKPLFRARLEPKAGQLPPREKPYLAFAGLGYPEKFFDFLENVISYNIVDTVRYADHYPYTERDVRGLQEKAQRLNAALLTTEKDYLRMPKLPGMEVFTVPITLRWEDEQALQQFLQERLPVKEP